MINILYETDALIIVEKPSGMPTQPDKTGDLDLWTQLQSQCKQELLILHRLDRPVGGVMLFGKATAKKQIAHIKWNRTYLAVVDGVLSQKKGTYTDFLYKDVRANISKVVSKEKKGAKQAILHYEVVNEHATSDGNQYSLVKIQLETGRHHQIRVQMAHHGTPLLGDRKYNKNKSAYNDSIALWSYQAKCDDFCVTSYPTHTI